VLGGDRPEVAARHDGGALTVAWAPATVMASGGRDGRVVVGGRDGDAGGPWVERVAWRPDGGLLAAAVGRRLQLWSIAGECVGVTTDLPATVASIAWHPRGIVCAAATYGGVRLVRANGAAVVDHLSWTGSVLELAFSPDGRRLAHGNQDASVHFWDLKRGGELEMTGYETKVRELAWTGDGRYLLTGGGATITAWDFHRAGGPAGSRPLELETHEDRVTALAGQPRGDLVASGGRDGRLLVWRPGSDDLPLAGTALDGAVSALRWSPDGRRLAAGADGGEVVVLDVRPEGR
jgi:WD40 repeat protein